MFFALETILIIDQSEKEVGRHVGTKNSLCDMQCSTWNLVGIQGGRNLYVMAKILVTRVEAAKEKKRLKSVDKGVM